MIGQSPLTGEREVNSCIEKVESTYLPLPCNRLIKVVNTFSDNFVRPKEVNFNGILNLVLTTVRA